MYPQNGRKSRGGTMPVTNFMNLKTVEVGRGRNGYGFTITGQSPCLLSCILPGSPAELAGLKSGDCVIAVNGENVTRLSHEQFIKLIGETTGVLRLTVADLEPEESSDEEYYGHPYNIRKPYVNQRARSTTPGVNRSKMVLEDIQSGVLFHAYPARTQYSQQLYYDNHEYNRAMDNDSKFAPGHLSPFNKSGRPDPMLKKTPQRYENNYWNGRDLEPVDPRSKILKPKRKREQRIRTQSQRSYYVQEDPYEEDDEEADGDTRPLTPYELSNISYPSLQVTQRQGRQSAPLQSMYRTFDDESLLLRVVIGYLGSVDIPASANLPTASLQAIRGCVRRLRMDQRVHSLMLMEIRSDGIQLINANHKVTAQYPADRIAFSGLCPDDKRCFGVVTVQSNEENVSGRTAEEEEPIGSACHVFIVDPELSSHEMHSNISARFGLHCVPNPETHSCIEFPSASRIVLHHVAQFYRDKQDSSYFADFYGQAPYVSVSHRSNSNSSNSDSGFGNGTKPPSVTSGGDQVANQIVDVASHIRNQRANGALRASVGQHNSRVVHADINTLPSDAPFSSSASPSSMDLSPHAAQPVSNLKDKLTPRARPDPVRTHPHPTADMRKISREQTASVQLFDIGKNATLPAQDMNSNHLPLQNVENVSSMGRMQHGFVPGGHTYPHPSGQENFRYNDQQMIKGESMQEELTKRFLTAQARQDLVRRGSDCSEYSTNNVQVRRLHPPSRQAYGRKLSALQQRSRESLAASDSELPTLDDPLRGDVTCGSQADLTDCNQQDIGRVSGWAVSFERLLKDELGLAYFTDFLKQEFSVENILFWIDCEKLSKIQEPEQLKRKAQEIYQYYLAPKAAMPVNLEGDYKNMVETALKNPSPEMYIKQQQQILALKDQIFKLMKFDSYSRFLKSKLYQTCVLAEMGGNPLPHTHSKLMMQLVHSDKPAFPQVVQLDQESDQAKKKKAEKAQKNKKSIPDSPEKSKVEEPEERKKSLLPWFNRGRKQKGGSVREKDTVMEGESKFYVGSPNYQRSMSSGEAEFTKSAARMQSPTKQMVDAMPGFRVVFPNNQCIDVKVSPNKTIFDLLFPLCEEHGLTFQTAEIFIMESKELIDLKQDASILIGKEIMVERRVTFKIELPNRKVIGVKSKPNKKIIEVLRPVTYKYQLQLDALVVHLSDSPVPLDLDITVATLDNKRILIETLDQYSAGACKANSHQGKTDITKEKQSAASSTIPRVQEGHKGLVHSNSHSDQSKNNNTMPPGGFNVHQMNNNNKAAHGHEVRGLRVSAEADQLYKLVSKANRRRLDDQRGLTIRNLELPDFLLPKESKTTDSKNTHRPLRAVSSLGFNPSYEPADWLNQEKRRSEFAKSRKISLQEDLRPKSTPPRPYAEDKELDDSRGIIPTHEEAESVFGVGNMNAANLSFGESMGSSGYLESSINTNRSFPDTVSTVTSPQNGTNDDSFDHRPSDGFRNGEFYRLDDAQRGEEDGRDEFGRTYNPKTSGISITSISVSSGELQSPMKDFDTTLTPQSLADIFPPPPPEDPDATLNVSVANFSPPTPHVQNAARSTLPGYQPDVNHQPLMHVDDYSVRGSTFNGVSASYPADVLQVRPTFHGEYHTAPSHTSTHNTHSHHQSHDTRQSHQGAAPSHSNLKENNIYNHTGSVTSKPPVIPRKSITVEKSYSSQAGLPNKPTPPYRPPHPQTGSELQEASKCKPPVAKKPARSKQPGTNPSIKRGANSSNVQRVFIGGGDTTTSNESDAKALRATFV